MSRQNIGDVALRQLIDDMRLMRHPAKEWQQERMYGAIEVTRKYMAPSSELVKEAMAEADALRRNQPAKPYQRPFEVPSFSQCQQ